eukprot:2253648-Rhodomonas_salina.1
MLGNLHGCYHTGVGESGPCEGDGGGLLLGSCDVTMLGAGMGERLDARRRAAEEGAGEVTNFVNQGGKMIQMVVSLDRGGYILCQD